MWDSLARREWRRGERRNPPTDPREPAPPREATTRNSSARTRGAALAKRTARPERRPRQTPRPRVQRRVEESGSAGRAGEEGPSVLGRGGGRRTPARGGSFQTPAGRLEAPLDEVPAAAREGADLPRDDPGRRPEGRSASCVGVPAEGRGSYVHRREFPSAPPSRLDVRRLAASFPPSPRTPIIVFSYARDEILCGIVGLNGLTTTLL